MLFLEKVNQAMAFYGSISLIILCFHLYIRDHIPKYSFLTYHWAVETVSILMICSIISYASNGAYFLSVMFNPNNAKKLKMK